MNTKGQEGPCTHRCKRQVPETGSQTSSRGERFGCTGQASLIPTKHRRVIHFSCAYKNKLPCKEIQIDFSSICALLRGDAISRSCRCVFPIPDSQVQHSTYVLFHGCCSLCGQVMNTNVCSYSLKTVFLCPAPEQQPHWGTHFQWVGCRVSGHV